MTDPVDAAKELVEHLRESADGLPECPAARNYREAADLLTTQAARIAELERENAELDFLSSEGGTWEEQLSKAEARAEAAEAEVTRLREALERANERLPGVKTPMMGGDNLAILLCSFFDDGDKETEDDTRWSQNARDGYEEVIAAIRHHYSAALRAKEP